jgi:hypothetical protein
MNYSTKDVTCVRDENNKFLRVEVVPGAKKYQEGWLVSPVYPPKTEVPKPDNVLTITKIKI